MHKRLTNSEGKKEVKTKKVFLTILITIVITSLAMIHPLTFTANAAVPTEPHNANAMWIEPSTIELNTSETPIGYKFNITLWANSSLETKGWQFWMFYAKAYINATRIGYTAGSKSEFFQDIVTLPVTPAFIAYNVTHNRLDFGEAWIMGPYRSPGYGSLCWIEFEVVALPPEGVLVDIPLDVNYAYELLEPPQTYLLYSDGSKRPLNVYNGLVRFVEGEAPDTEPPIITVLSPENKTYMTTSIPLTFAVDETTSWIGYSLDGEMNITITGNIILSGLSYQNHNVIVYANDTCGNMGSSDRVYFTIIYPEGARIFVDPPEIIDPTMSPSSTFSVNITVDDVGNLKVCKFNMSYNTEIISWIGLKLFKVQNQTPTAVAMMDDEIGFIWVKLTYGTELTISEPMALVKLDFHVDAFGCTPLDLHDTILLNSEGEPIEHMTEDGYFCTLIRDVAVTNVVPEQNWAYQGWTINISITVVNGGMISETFTVEAYYNRNLLGNTTVEDLPPGNETTIIIPWNTQNVTACTNYTISAEIPPVPYELNLVDNQYSDGTVKIRLMGDVNGDGYVGADDIVIVAEAFGAHPEHPRWNIYADLNRDNYVGIDDIVIVASNFGSLC